MATPLRTLLLAASLGLLASCRSQRSGSLSEGPLVPIDGPGLQRAIRATPGEAAVVVNFWATWCEPCKEELPMLVDVGRAYAPQGVTLRFVSMDFEEEHPAALAHLEAQGAPLPTFARIGKDDPFIRSVHPEWSGALPATIVYGPNRELRYFWEGKIDEGLLTEALDTLVAEVPSDPRPRWEMSRP